MPCIYITQFFKAVPRNTAYVLKYVLNERVQVITVRAQKF